jgi:Glyoxalase-like domain
MSADVRWLTIMLDTAQESAEEAEIFWSRITGHPLSPRRGERSEFATYLPPDGDACLKAQRVVQTPPGGLHLDVHTDDIRAFAAHAEALGASTSYHDAGYVVCGSPGGMTFCVVSHHAGAVPAPATWPGGRSAVDQVCLDIPASRFDDECGFWSDLTGWELFDSEPDDEFRRLRRPEDVAIQVLLQRLDDDQPVVTGHVDLGSDDYLAEAERHRALGAREIRRTPHWVTFLDPAGRAYCVTRHPVSTPVTPES